LALDRQYMLNEFLRNIAGISDKKYQNRVWIRAEGPECDDFTETVCRFFDIGEPILDDYKNFGITDHQYQLLITFQAIFREFADENDLPQEFIENPEWKKIMDMATEILEAFQYQKKSVK
jgi:hypothetical protein